MFEELNAYYSAPGRLVGMKDDHASAGAAPAPPTPPEAPPRQRAMSQRPGRR
jgi:hypothetical protein